MDKIKNQLAGVAALLGVIAAIGGGFVKYGEIVTKLEALEAREEVKIDTTGIEMSLAVVEEKVNKLENADTSHEHEQEKHSHTVSLVNKKEIEIIKVQIEEIKAKASNPLQ